MGHATDEYEDMMREEARRQALQDEIDRLRPDAERYRWLRDKASQEQVEKFIVRRGTRLAADRVCDTGVDDAMREQGANKS